MKECELIDIVIVNINCVSFSFLQGSAHSMFIGIYTWYEGYRDHERYVFHSLRGCLFLTVLHDFPHFLQANARIVSEIMP
jgi:hypothetical protein